MSIESDTTIQRGQSFFPWIFRKITPALFVGGIVGCTIGLLATHNASLLRVLSIVAAVFFALGAILYFYWASCTTNGGGYRWSALERLGIAVSGFAALMLAVKLAFPDMLPGAHFLYLMGALILAFVVRPVLDCLGFNKNNSEQPGALQQTTHSESKSEGEDKPQPESEGLADCHASTFATKNETKHTTW